MTVEVDTIQARLMNRLIALGVNTDYVDRTLKINLGLPNCKDEDAVKNLIGYLPEAITDDCWALYEIVDKKTGTQCNVGVTGVITDEGRLKDIDSMVTDIVLFNAMYLTQDWHGAKVMAKRMTEAWCKKGCPPSEYSPYFTGAVQAPVYTNAITPAAPAPLPPNATLQTALKDMPLWLRQFRWNFKIQDVDDDMRPLMIAGPAGCGKTQSVIDYLEQNKIEYRLMCKVTDQYSLTGYVDADSKHVSTALIDCAVNGWVFILDEYDRVDGDLTTALNSILANGVFTTGWGETIHIHPKFRFIATANTLGQGSSEDYTDAKKQDTAALDRQIPIFATYDEGVELKCANGDQKLVEFIHDYRASIDTCQIPRVICSYRGIKNLAFMLANCMSDELGPIYTLPEVIRTCVTKDAVAPDELHSIYNGLKNKRNRYAKALKELIETLEGSVIEEE